MTRLVSIDESKLARLTNAVHVNVALEDGPKAGFRSYMSSVGHKPEYDNLNAKRGFDRYCGEFGPYLEVLGLTANPVVEEQVDDAVESIAAQINALQAQLDALRAPRTSRVKAAVAKVTKSAPKKATPKAKKAASKFVGRESRFSNAVIERKGLPTDVGDTFVWDGTNGASTWEVVEDTGDEIFAVRIA